MNANEIDAIAVRRQSRVDRAHSHRDFPKCDDRDRPYLLQLSKLNGLDYYEKELVAKMLANGVCTRGDRLCLNEMRRKHLQ